MSAARRADPVRTCIGCRTRRLQRELVRITRAGDGDVVADGTSSGRGAWLCRSGGDSIVVPACLERALSKRAFARAWRSDVPADIERRLRELLGAPPVGR